MSLRNSFTKKEISKLPMDNQQNINQNQYNKISDVSSNKINDDNKKYYTKIHPLSFYALGKVPKSPKYTTFFSPNNGFRSTSNDILTRNLYSLNSSTYDSLLQTKNFSTISQQNIKENNYLKPLDAYKTYQKFNLPSNAINRETYNIEKEKIFVRSDTSLIKKGMYMTFSSFNINKKKLLLDNDNPKNFNKTMNASISNRNLEKMNKEIHFNNINKNNKNSETKTKNKFDFNSNNNDNNNNKDNNEFNKPKIKYINPIDYNKKKLKGNFFYFDRNNKQFLRHKNWWISDM